MSNQNPFLVDDLVATIARDTESVQNTQQSSLQAFLSTQKTQTTAQTNNATPTKTPKPNLNFNLSHFMSYNFTHFTRFSIAGLSLFTVLAGGVATQALAPDNLKPTQVVSNIFSANKQKDSNPKTALMPDNDNYVSNLEGCDMSIKYPKKSDYTSVKTNIAKDRSEFYFHQANTSENYLQINCVQKNADEYYYKSLENLLQENIPNLKSQPISNKELASSTGWFISETSFIEIIKTTWDKYELYNILNTKTQQKTIIWIDSNKLKPQDFQLQFNFAIINISDRDVNKPDVSSCIGEILQTTDKPTKVLSLNDKVRNTYYWNDISLNDISFSRIAVDCSVDSNEITNLTKDQPKTIETLYNLNSVLKKDFVLTIKPDSITSFSSLKNSHYINFETNNNNFYSIYFGK